MFEYQKPKITAKLILETNLVYGNVQSQNLHLNIVYPSEPANKPRPLVITVAGHSAWMTSRYADGMATECCPSMASHGFVAVSVEVRTSGEAPFPAQLEDISAAIAWLCDHAENFSIDTTAIGLWGHSASGHVAALAGLILEKPRIRAVAIASAPTNLQAFGQEIQNDSPVLIQLLGGTVEAKKELAFRASPIYHVREDAPAFLVIHGTLDETVPYQQAESLVKKLRDVGGDVELVTLKGCYHNLATELQTASGYGNEGLLDHLAIQFFRDQLINASAVAEFIKS
jgi:acetyl esterase/lipase